MMLETSSPVPLARDESGVIRVKDSRVTLESIVDEFKRGSSPEQIQEDFPTLELAEVYSIIAYYLTHEQAIEQYLREQEEISSEIQRRVANDPGNAKTRARIIARCRARREV